MAIPKPKQSVVVPPATDTLPPGGLGLILGPANSGKLGRVIAWWQRALPWRPVIVVPTASVAEEVTRELLRRTGAVIGQTQALTFDGLAREILGERPAYVGEFQREILLAGILQSVPLTALGSAVRFPGLTTSLGSLLLQFAESGRTPAELEDILCEWARREPQMAALAGDVRQIASAYEASCASLGVVDRPAIVRAACERAVAWSRPTGFYGFTSFTAGQRRLIETLAGRVPVLVTFDYERGRPVSLADPTEVARWEPVAAEVEELPPQPRAYSSPAIAYLERHLLSDRAHATSSPLDADGVRFLLAAGERSEAELVAQHVVRVIDEGFAPEDIAIIVRDVPTRGRLVGRVLDSCAVPYHLDTGLTLAQTGLGHAFLNALRGVTQADPHALLAYLTGPYSGLSWAESADMELRYRRHSAGDFQALAALVDAAAPHVLHSVRRGLAEHVDGLALDPPGLRLLAYEMLAAGLEGAEPVEGEAEADILAFNALQEALVGLEKTFGEGVPRMGLLPGTILAALAGVQVRRAAARSEAGVSVITPARARARRFAVVFILGLVEGEFPARSDRPSLLTEAQKRALEAVGGSGLLARQEDDEEALFVSAVSRAWQVLYLSARDADDGGSEVLPSHFWSQAKELLGRGADDHDKRTLGDVVFTMDSAPALRHYRRARAAARAGSGDHTWRRPAAFLSDPAVLAELASVDYVSPSALESYLACPFAWFLERVVGVEDFAEELDGRTVGNLLHGAVSRVYRQLMEDGRTPLRQEDVPEALELGGAAVDELAAGGDCPGTAGERRVAAWRVKNLLRTLLLMEAASGSRLVTQGTEVQVGGEAGVDIGGLRVRGRVDRIDGDPTGGGLFVVDYKSGRVPSSKRIGTEEGLQLPLYLLALGAEGAGRSLLGGVYLSPAEQKRSGFVLADHEEVLGLAAGASAGFLHLSPEAAEEFYEAVRGLALRAAEAMRGGVIAPLPDRSCPSWCDLRSACRAHRGRAGS